MFCINSSFLLFFVLLATFFHWNLFLFRIDVYTTNHTNKTKQNDTEIRERKKKREELYPIFSLAAIWSTMIWKMRIRVHAFNGRAILMCARRTLWSMQQQQPQFSRAHTHTPSHSKAFSCSWAWWANSQRNNWKIDHQQHFYMEYHLIVFCFIRFSFSMCFFYLYFPADPGDYFYCVRLHSLTQAFRSLFLLSFGGFFLLSCFFDRIDLIFWWSHSLQCRLYAQFLFRFRVYFLSIDRWTRSIWRVHFGKWIVFFCWALMRI